MSRRSMAPIWGGAFALAACTGGGVGGEDPRVVRRDSAGVSIMENRLGAADTLELTRPLLAIGDNETVAQAVFQEVQSVAALRDGRIVVVDREPRIVLFDSTGAWVRDLARKGGGPGEYSVPTWVLVQGDTVVVWDVARRRLLRHTWDGTPLDDIVISTRAAGLPMRPLAGGWIDEGEIGQGPDTARAAAFLVRRGGDGSLLDTVLAPYPVAEIGWQIDAATQTGQMVNPPLQPASSLDHIGCQDCVVIR